MRLSPIHFFFKSLVGTIIWNFLYLSFLMTLYAILTENYPYKKSESCFVLPFFLLVREMVEPSLLLVGQPPPTVNTLLAQLGRQLNKRHYSVHALNIHRSFVINIPCTMYVQCTYRVHALTTYIICKY